MWWCWVSSPTQTWSTIASKEKSGLSTKHSSMSAQWQPRLGLEMSLQKRNAARSWLCLLRASASRFLVFSAAKLINKVKSAKSSYPKMRLVDKGIIKLQKWIKKRSSNYAKKDFIERVFDKRTIMLLYFTSGICLFVVLPSFLFRYMEGWTYLGSSL